jgi:hypothetical protein
MRQVSLLVSVLCLTVLIGCKDDEPKPAANMTAEEGNASARGMVPPPAEAMEPAERAEAIKAGIPPKPVEAATGDAQKLIDEALQYIKDNKLDLAESTLKKVEGMRASLSPELQTALDNANKALAAAKLGSGSGVKLPGM